MREFHDIKYINWNREATLIKKITYSEFKELQKELSSLNEAKDLTLRYQYISSKIDTYYIKRRGYWYYVYIYRVKTKEFQVYTTSAIDKNKNINKPKLTGTDAIISVHEDFKSKYGVTFRKAFGYSDELVKRCIPKAFSYVNEEKMGKLLEGVNYSDISSCFPANICGDLPDWNNQIGKFGTVKPTEEYPFAFYIRSGHIAEYNKYDSHDWLDSLYGANMFRLKKIKGKSIEEWLLNSIPPEEDFTILCKKSQYKLEELYKTYYNEKNKYESGTEEYALNKLKLNSSIGCMHRAKYDRHRLAHLVAVVIARSNAKMLRMCKLIGNKNIVHVVTDGIIYQKLKPLGTKEKKLGEFHIEFSNAKMICLKTNQWIAETDQGFYCKHGAIELPEDYVPKDINEIFKWREENE